MDAPLDATPVIARFIRSGQLRPLLATSNRRVPAIPDVHTTAAAGLKDFSVISGVGLHGPPHLLPGLRKANNFRAD